MYGTISLAVIKEPVADVVSEDIFTHHFSSSSTRHLMNSGICRDACTAVKSKSRYQLIFPCHRKKQNSSPYRSAVESLHLYCDKSEASLSPGSMVFYLQHMKLIDLT